MSPGLVPAVTVGYSMPATSLPVASKLTVASPVVFTPARPLSSPDVPSARFSGALGCGTVAVQAGPVRSLVHTPRLSSATMAAFFTGVCTRPHWTGLHRHRAAAQGATEP